MNKYQLYTLGGCLLAAASLSGCASDGSFASKARPVDKSATLEAVCTAIATADGTFQAFAAASPGRVDKNGMDTEGAIVAAFYARDPNGLLAPVGVCKPPYDGNMQAAINSVVAAIVKVTALLANWQK